MESKPGLRQIVQGLLTLPIFAVALIILLLTGLLLPIKALIFILAKVFRPDLTDFMGGLSHLFSYLPLMNLTYFMYIDGVVSTEMCRFHFQDSVLNPKFPKFYKRLQQTWTSFCGYKFWRNDPKYKIENHIRDYDYSGELQLTSGCTEEDVRSVYPKLLVAPWKDGQSPWEMLSIPISSGRESKTLCIFRHHHALMDGFSAVEMLKEVFKTKFPVKPTDALKRKRIFQWQPFLRLPYDFAGVLLAILDFENKWHYPPVGGTREFQTVVVSSVTVDMVKKVKSQVGAPYAAILLSAVGGGIQRMFQEAQLPVPKYLSTLLPLPKPNHPGGSVNHLCLTYIHWPIKGISAIERARQIQAKLQNLVNPALYITMTAVPTVFGSLPTIIASQLLHIMTAGTSALVSVFPVSEEPCYALGSPIDRLEVAFGTPGQSNGTSILITGVNGKQKILFNMDTRIFPSGKLFSNFGTFVEAELHSMIPLNQESLNTIDKKDR